ncbi:hypothetical protein AEA42_07410, partial [Shewanella sp. Sh95]
VGRVVGVGEARRRAGRDRGDEPVRGPRGGQARAQVRDVGRDGVVARVGERARAPREGRGGLAAHDARARVLVRRGEQLVVAPVHEPGRAQVAGGRQVPLDRPRHRLVELEAARAGERVRPPRAEVDAAAHGLAVLAVARD